MLFPSIALDAAMSASDVLARLAQYGLWRDPQHPAAKPWIDEQAALWNLPFEEAVERIRRHPREFGAAIRRQWNANVLWYAISARDVLEACADAAPNATLLDALGLHEPDSLIPLTVPAGDEVPNVDGVVLAGNTPVAVSIAVQQKARGGPGIGRAGIGRGEVGPGKGKTERARALPGRIGMWPRLDAPEYVPALKPFEVTVGLTQKQQPGVKGAKLSLPVPAGAETIDLSVELIADGVDAPDGWSRELRVSVRNPSSARVTFRLVGREPEGREPRLTRLEVRYVLEGTVCGTASRPLVIGRASEATLPESGAYGTPWLEKGPRYSSVELRADEAAVDLTIEIAKPDGNEAGGLFTCRLYSPHPIKANRGPHQISLGQDAKTFAKGHVNSLRQADNSPLVDNGLRALGMAVARKLPQPAVDALREVAKLVDPELPTVLIVSAEPYVPWELALIDPPLNAKHPSYLGAQALVGRWLRDTEGESRKPSTKGTPGANASTIFDRPPPQPPSTIEVSRMAVMAAMYKKKSKLTRLPGAEEEAADLTQTYDAVPLGATREALQQLLDAEIVHKFQQVGGAGAVHFAGHGSFDPGDPNESVLFLSDGTEIASSFFSATKYDDKLQPFIFLNACMIGTGGEVLGSMGGFPGNCLRGGFGALLGALWVVDDEVARDVAIEFWRRALSTPSGLSEPVGAILRGLRAKYDPKTAPWATYLAYVYYGHPRLRLRWSVPGKPVSTTGKGGQKGKKLPARP